MISKKITPSNYKINENDSSEIINLKLLISDLLKECRQQDYAILALRMAIKYKTGMDVAQAAGLNFEEINHV